VRCGHIWQVLGRLLFQERVLGLGYYRAEVAPGCLTADISIERQRNAPIDQHSRNWLCGKVTRAPSVTGSWVKLMRQLPVASLGDGDVGTMLSPSFLLILMLSAHSSNLLTFCPLPMTLVLLVCRRLSYWFDGGQACRAPDWAFSVWDVEAKASLLW